MNRTIKVAIFTLILTLTANTAFAQTRTKADCACGDLLIEGPSTSTQAGDTMTFSASLTGEKGVTYKWEVDKGKIISGQGTSTIKVSTTGLGGEALVATVTTKSSCEKCTHTESETGIVVAAAPTATKLEEFESLADNNSKSRLDAFIVELQNQSSAEGYVVNFGTKQQVDQMQQFIRNHLISRKLDIRRVVFMNYGEGRVITQLWIVPPGAATDFDTTPGKPADSIFENLEPTTAEEFYKRGVFFAEKCQYQNSISEFTNAIKLDPTNGDYYKDRAYANLYIDTAKAQPDMKRAEELWNLEPQPKFNSTDKIKKARYDAKIILRKSYKTTFQAEITSLRSANILNRTNKNYLESKCGQTYNNPTKANQNSGSSSQNANVYKTKDSAADYNKQGLKYLEVCNYQQAVAEFTKAIELAPNSFEYYFNRATAYIYIDRVKAREDLSKAKLNSEREEILWSVREVRNSQIEKLDSNMMVAAINGGKYPRPKSCPALANQSTTNKSQNSNQNSGNSNQPGNSSATSQKTATEYSDSGKKLLDKKDFDGAIRDFTEAIRLKPQYSFYYSYRAEAYEGKNLLDKALSDFSKAVELNNGYSLNYDRRSKVYRKLKRYNEALADLDNAKKFQDDKFPSSFYITDKIEIYREMKNHSAALKEINDLITQSGKYTEYLLTRAEIKTDLNDKRGAIADYTEIIEAYGNQATLPKVYFAQSSLYQSLGENEKAKQDFDNFSQANYIQGEIRQADIEEERKQFAEAIGTLSSVINENGTNSFLYYKRGSLYEKTNQTEKAADDFKKSTRYATRISDKFYKAESHKKLADYFYKKGNFQDALFEINESLKMDSVIIFSDDKRELRGNIYFALGEYQNAIKDFEEAKKADMFGIISPEAEKNLNAAYCKIGNSSCKK